VMWECRDQLNRKYFEPHQPLDAQKCVRICAYSSLREMVPPGMLAVVIPLVIGTSLGPKGLLGMLLGAISSGFLMGVMMSNAGGAWDNAKKYVEKGNLGPGKGKKTDNHKATVVGDTVGDPFKDTSGPSLNILIKLMSIVALVIAPLLTKTVNGVKVPKDDWEDWWVACIIIAILLILAWIYSKLMARYGTVHDREFIGREAEKRKKEVAAGGGGDKKREEDKDHARAEEFSSGSGDVSLDSVAKGKQKRLPGDGSGGYGALPH